MTKKLIISLLAIAIVVVCVFAACEGKDSTSDNKGLFNKETTKEIYIDEDEYPFVTDENGEKVLNENGEFVVYSTLENGIIAKDENGEKVIARRPFEAYAGDGFVEEYGYRFTFPEGWSATSETGRFENKKTGDELDVSVADKSYQDFYDSNYKTYKYIANEELSEDAADLTVTWEEDLDFFGEDCEGVVRFTLTSGKNATNVMYFFRNEGNIYKILFESKSDKATAIKESETVCKAITFKPYDYFEPVTDENGREVMDIFPNQSTTQKEEKK